MYAEAGELVDGSKATRLDSYRRAGWSVFRRKIEKITTYEAMKLTADDADATNLN